MRITISIEGIIKDIRTKSHLEVASIADPSARYRVEAGTEKLSEVKRDIADAVSTLVERCYRFLDMPGIDGVNDAITDKDVILNLTAGPRRMEGKEKALAQKIHEIIVDLSMQKFYVSVLQPELSKVHLSQANAGIAELEEMLRRKRPPIYIDR